MTIADQSDHSIDEAVVEKSTVTRVPVGEVSLFGKHRAVDQRRVKDLAESMSRIGLRTPITLRRLAGGMAIVAGRHRVLAAKSLGWRDIDAFVFDGDEINARLWTISENLHRAELTVLERSEQTAEWVRLHEAKSAVNGQAVQKPQGGRPEGATTKAARELPVRGRTLTARRHSINRDQNIDSISPEGKAAAIVHGHDDNQTALLEIAQEPTPEGQVNRARSMAGREPASRPKRKRPQTIHDVERLTAELAERAAEVERLRSQLADRTEEVGRLRAELADAAQLLRELQDELDESRRLIATSEPADESAEDSNSNQTQLDLFQLGSSPVIAAEELIDDNKGFAATPETAPVNGGQE
jgi:ParB family transcriptional regulator, chromosome partitioning protein